MKLIGIADENFNHYKKPSMVLSTSRCHRKCLGCQNEHLKTNTAYEHNDLYIITRYLKNPITQAIVFGGLEPFDTYDELRFFYKLLRNKTNDTVIIYTGYTKEEVILKVKDLVSFGGHLIVKYGEYIEGHESHMDNILGVELASNNQFAEEYNGKNNI